MKKLLVTLVGICLVVSLLLMACGNPAASTTSPSQTTNAAATKPVATVDTSDPQQPQETDPTSSADTSKYGGILKVIIRNPQSIIGTPSEGAGGAPHRMVEWAYDFLLRYDENYNYAPRMADSWEIAPDGKSITFHLHPGIKFHDGLPFNAEAVKANLEIYAPNGVRPPALKKITSYDIIDEYTIRLNLSDFDSSLLIELGDGAGFMCSPAALAKETTPENMAKDHLVGTGPFILSSFEKNQRIVYTKNPDYYQEGKPYLDGAEVLMIQDPVTSIMSFKKGEAQVIFGITPPEATDLAASGFDVVTSDIKPIVVLLPDGKNANSPWADMRVREALEYAIDKPALAASIGEGYYEAVTQFATTGSAFFNPEAVTREYNPQKARELLAEAGHPNGFKTKIYCGTSYDRDILVAIQTYLQEVGIQAELDLGDPAQVTDWQNNGWNNGIFVLDFLSYLI